MEGTHARIQIAGRMAAAVSIRTLDSNSKTVAAVRVWPLGRPGASVHDRGTLIVATPGAQISPSVGFGMAPGAVPNCRDMGVRRSGAVRAAQWCASRAVDVARASRPAQRWCAPPMVHEPDWRMAARSVTTPVGNSGSHRARHEGCRCRPVPLDPCCHRPGTTHEQPTRWGHSAAQPAGRGPTWAPVSAKRTPPGPTTGPSW